MPRPPWMRGCRARMPKKDGNKRERERERERKRKLMLEFDEAVANVKIIAAKLKSVMRTSAEGGSKMTKRQNAANQSGNADTKKEANVRCRVHTGARTSLTHKNRTKASAATKTIVRTKAAPSKVPANTARKPGPRIDVTAIHSVSRQHDRKVTYKVSDGSGSNEVNFHFDAANRTDRCKLLRLLNDFYGSDFLCASGDNAHMRHTVLKHIEMLTESIAASGQGTHIAFPPVPGSPDWLTAGHPKNTRGTQLAQLACTPTVLSVALYTAPIELGQ
jgi:hypothetical protein